MFTKSLKSKRKIILGKSYPQKYLQKISYLSKELLQFISGIYIWK